MASEAQISTVIVNWNRADDLRRLLGDLSVQTQPAEEVIVVDNGSTDESREMLAREFPAVRLIALDRNTGLSHGRNVGIEAARSEWIAILDNDLRIPDREFCRKARQSIACHADCGAITFHLFQGLWAPPSGDGPMDVRTLSELEHLGRDGVAPVESRPYYVWFVSGGCCLISRRTVEGVGGFDPFFAYGGEEWDFAYRCHAAGIPMLRDPSLWAVHAQSPSMRSPHAPQLILRNMIVAQARYMPAFDLVVFLVLQLSSSAFHALRSRKTTAFLRVLGRLVRVWPTQVRARRRPVARAVMRRFYYLRLHRPTNYLSVDRATTSVSEFYWARARRVTPEQADTPSLVLMQQ